MSETLDAIAALADEFDRRSLAHSQEAKPLSKDLARGAALRGKARGYAEAATSLRAAFSIPDPRTSPAR